MKFDIDLDAITILFIGLKLTGNIHWPWWKVLAPTLLKIAAHALIAVLKAHYEKTHRELREMKK